ncbi:MAG: ATP-dependent helicase HrpB [Pseudomonadota bacterium]
MLNDVLADVRSRLPVASILTEISDALIESSVAIVQAPPGTGKTSLIPLALVESSWLGDKSIVVLEPRRIAARAAATRMATLIGERPGERVGYRVRFETKVSSETRVEVITEGVLIRMLQSDPMLSDVGLVIFDEFHERSLDADLAFSLIREVQTGVRDDLKIVLMSATLDGEQLAQCLPHATVLSVQANIHPVEMIYRPLGDSMPSPSAVAETIERALAEVGGDLLVFLPGRAEISRTADALGDADAQVLPLYAALSLNEQAAALRPSASGARKIVLATNIAESNLTIEGTRCVIDAGWERRPRYDPNTGLSRLTTQRISIDSAVQRAGRAGRTGPGVCYRLWSEADERRMPRSVAPEILDADLAPLALELALWGAPPEKLEWINRPPRGAFESATDLLTRLGALDAERRITHRGRAMCQLGVHPRLAAMLTNAGPADQTRAGLLAALIEEGGLGRDDIDIDIQFERLMRMHAGEPVAGVRPDRARRILHAARDLARNRDKSTAVDGPPASVGELLLAAYPDRVAQRRQAVGSDYRLANGRGLRFEVGESLTRAEYLVVPVLDAGARNARAFLAAAVDRESLFKRLDRLFEYSEQVGWDERESMVRAERIVSLDHLVLDRTALADPPPEQLVNAMLDGVAQVGIHCLPWTDAVNDWRARVSALHHWQPEADWPDLRDDVLVTSMDEWLGPHLHGCRRINHLSRLDLFSIVRAIVPWSRHSAIERLAPTHLHVPSGSRIRLRYEAEQPPVLSVRLQELFGLLETPCVCDGAMPVVIELLSPAARPVQVTQDLKSFWANGYAQVRREMRGRYPKHYWPEDPLTAVATRRVRPRTK